MPFVRFHPLWTGLARLVTATLLAGLCSAQTGSPAGIWSLPSDGYLYDQLNRSIRPVTGFAGSAVLGSPVVSGIGWAAIAPNGKSAIFEQSGSLIWIADLSNSTQSQTLSSIAQARQAFWAADSSRAVILTRDSQIIWLTHFDSSPGSEAAWQLVNPLPAGRDAHWSLLAADSAADKVLLAAPTANGPALWIASRESAPASLSLSVRPAAAVFVPGKAAAYVADAAANQIVEIQGLDGAPSMTQILSSGVYVTDPAGITLSTGADRLFLVNRASTTVYEFDSGSGALLAQIQAEEAPRSLAAVSATRFLFEPAGGNSADPSSRPVLLLDTSQPARVLFVPRGQ